MHNIVFLILRRMRQPLLTLIAAYAVAILGLIIIPGQDDAGHPWHMDIFHAFYFVSFMSTTIGFGEIPYAFTDAQRMWVTFTVYATVISWIYAIGTLLTLVQDKTFQEAIEESRFARRIRRQREPFHLVCGYGETGRALVQALTERHQQAVVVDSNEMRTSLLKLQNLREYVPALHGDAMKPRHLIEAGLQHPKCAGVVALTDKNEVNLKIAITAKLLNSRLKAICRADSHDVEANMASFGTDYIIDPFDTFAAHLGTALQAPCLYLLRDWTSSVEETELSEPIYPPRDGHWIICGYGRMGKAVHQRLHEQGIKTTVLEVNPEITGRPPEGMVIGRGTEAETLLQAGIHSAVGLVAGTDDDANNLSIVMTARDLNPQLFVIARQNRDYNRELFDSVRADMVMQPSTIVAGKIRVLLATPMLYDFMAQAQQQPDDWACQLVSRISALVKNKTPAILEVTLDEEQAWAVQLALAAGQPVGCGVLLRDPLQADRQLQAIVLMHQRGHDQVMLPEDDQPLMPGDRLLFCGNREAFDAMRWSLGHVHTLNYLLTGVPWPQAWIWRKWLAWRGKEVNDISWL